VVETSHDLYLFDEGLFSILFAVGVLFGEGFHGVFDFVLVFLDEVDWGEVALSDLFYGFEGLVEGFLVEVQSEDFSP
jgi:hypothetical protein